MLLARIFALLGTLIAIGVPTWAQSDRATITGSVTDPSGAVVNGAKVKATHVATNQEHATVASGQGDYTLPQLPVG